LNLGIAINFDFLSLLLRNFEKVTETDIESTVFE